MGRLPLAGRALGASGRAGGRAGGEARLRPCAHLMGLPMPRCLPAARHPCTQPCVTSRESRRVHQRWWGRGVERAGGGRGGGTSALTTLTPATRSPCHTWHPPLHPDSRACVAVFTHPRTAQAPDALPDLFSPSGRRTGMVRTRHMVQRAHSGPDSTVACEADSTVRAWGLPARPGPRRRVARRKPTTSDCHGVQWIGLPEPALLRVFELLSRGDTAAVRPRATPSRDDLGGGLGAHTAAPAARRAGRSARGARSTERAARSAASRAAASRPAPPRPRPRSSAMQPRAAPRGSRPRWT